MSLKKVSGWWIAVIAFFIGFSVWSDAAAAAEKKRPNILLVLADDLGFSDLGCYGSEIATPNLDSLAANGLRYSQFYNTARCWPTRAALLTGFYAQQVQRDAFPNSRHGGHGKRPVWAELLPKMLSRHGYRSYHSGKWHIDSTPLKSGFDRAYTLEDHNRYFSPKSHTQDGVPLAAVEPNEGYYATTAIADYAIECLVDHAKNHGDQPFFQYVAFNAPHFPLHAPAEDVARYANKYRDGWDKARQSRWKRLRSFGVLSGSLSQLESQIGPPYHFPEALEILGDGEVNRELPWSTLSKEQQAFQSAKMAVHAAMIDRLDRELGRILNCLRENGDFNDTLILFLSDNGASAEIMVRGDGHDKKATFGSADSYLCLGPGWSTVANTPFRRHKTWVHEGGISTPLIAHWPAGIQKTGQWRRAIGHVVDVVPTVMEVAGGMPPGADKMDNIPQRPGVSLVGTFNTDKSLDRDVLWWLHEGNRALRSGDWKLVAAKHDPWELYNLASDRAETSNLASTNAEKVAELENIWTKMSERMQQALAQQRMPSDRKADRQALRATQ